MPNFHISLRHRHLPPALSLQQSPKCILPSYLLLWAIHPSSTQRPNPNGLHECLLAYPRHSPYRSSLISLPVTSSSRPSMAGGIKLNPSPCSSIRPLYMIPVRTFISTSQPTSRPTQSWTHGYCNTPGRQHNSLIDNTDAYIKSLDSWFAPQLCSQVLLVRRPRHVQSSLLRRHLVTSSARVWFSSSTSQVSNHRAWVNFFLKLAFIRLG